MSADNELALPRGTKVPDHIAIILDGNRRWARARGLAASEGHKAGYQAVRKLARSARQLGIHTFTIWAFSTENWERSKKEIDAIFNLLRIGLREFEKEAHKEKVRLVHLGRKDRFPEDISRTISKVEESTRKYSGHILNLALDYGGRDELLRAVKKIIDEKIPSDKVDEKLFASYLDTNDQPYPYVDLFIRTSGEQRTSGLLPWQMAYAEYYWDSDHLPDFTPEKLREAILDYSRRRRRFGGNDNVEHLAFDPEVVAHLELAWWRLRKIPHGTRLRDYAIQHLIKQYGLSKDLAKDAAKYFLEAFLEQDNGQNWERAIKKLKSFYRLIKGELKLAFEPSIVASLQVKFWNDVADKEGIESVGDAEETAKKLYAEVYRISLFQAAKAAHLMVLANIERNLAERGFGEHHWAKAEDYLQRFYIALKERVA
ncbi:di-trans,poly-cis-decaprenylcistransferase [Candidatus Woesebacteria bacterium RIFCSPHIGHO2_12_FULL_46_16]|uniref:Isoprenyl transferase n=2 Tax=Microgenomates group TaxID=1794810 RepID=A0A0H4T656_9BACT|nr:di-trans,poly-cis-decaprenylcistransferase, undecaprenyl diphosphate synthase [uncultured Microgenomates bacterium Rifle_16ft_4_minimus_37906]OGM57938.1 MAG: di-trans,poly-cis-decaprenylcistransferase [Candidatus Woesebacteria bacterium RIFCSPHIGHO2_12_FULL_46_16]